MTPPSLLVATGLAPGATVILALLSTLALATGVVARPNGLGAHGALRAQVTSWWYLMPPVFLAWAVEPWGVPLLVLAISALAARDLRGLVAAGRSHRLVAGLIVLVALQALAMATGDALPGCLALLMIASAALARWCNGGRRGRTSLLLALFAAQAAGLLCLPVLAPLGPTDGTPADWFLYLCVVTALNDIGQFIAGTALGRHKLAARISPGKTWQGLGGGLVMSVGVSMLVGGGLGLASLPALAALGAVLCLAGLLGDLLFSAGKRALGVKDFSHLIPGHGGVLDRVDSLVLTAPALLLALRFL